jgi:GT2 family glycosyltransferase
VSRARGFEYRVKLVSVIIPALHRPDLTQRCLASLARQSLPQQEIETLVVENEARPDSILQPPFAENVRCLPLETNLGTTGSINLGLAQTHSQYVLLLNNDVELEPRYLEVLVAALAADPKLGFATGKLLNARRHGVLDGAGDALLRGGGAYRLGHDDPDQGRFDRPAFVLAACGAAALFRRPLLEEVRGLDEDFFAYLDDVDLALRVQAAGFHGEYLPEAIAWHLGSATLGDAFHPRIAELLTRNQLFLLWKNYPFGVLLRLCGHILVFQVLWLALMLRRGMVLPYARGVAAAFRQLPRMLAKRRWCLRQSRLNSREFLALLRASEEQIYEWQAARPAASRSALLATYFRFFKPWSRTGLNP